MDSAVIVHLVAFGEARYPQRFVTLGKSPWTSDARIERFVNITG